MDLVARADDDTRRRLQASQSISQVLDDIFINSPNEISKGNNALEESVFQISRSSLAFEDDLASCATSEERLSLNLQSIRRRVKALADRLVDGLCDVWSQIRGESAKQIANRIESLAKEINRSSALIPPATITNRRSNDDSERHSHLSLLIKLMVEALLELISERYGSESQSEQSWQVQSPY
jgi:hypothetical protein